MIKEKVDSKTNEKWVTDIFHKRYINLKKYLSFKDFEVLKGLNIKIGKMKCTDIELAVIKNSMDKYYDIRWLHFKNRTPNEDERLENFEYEKKEQEEFLNEGYISYIDETKSLDGTGISREEFENTFVKLEILQRATKIYKKLKKIEKQLSRKPTLSNTYKLLMLSNMQQIQELKL